ncbi:MAG: hypothetical protein KKC75_06635, partial [Nanoarchaeota archaeon]|nr:hypothetical protein [Nanoarchaeota archaeon]MBU1005529.1 hypothetical protein [Nanoarchaeota archaeon]MBU1945868.1 hypothetical protein [Nanoarchaeota archaeon]
ASSRNGTITIIHHGCDYDTPGTFLPAESYVFGGNSNPTVTLNYPGDGITFDTNYLFNCSAVRGSCSSVLINISLYHNASGWKINQTINISGSENTTIFGGINQTGNYKWNCLVYDNESHAVFASANYTFTQTQYPCDTGDLSSICYVNSAKRIRNGYIVNATNLVINSGGLLYNYSGVSISFNVSGNFTINSGGAINLSSSTDAGGSVNITADSIFIYGGLNCSGNTVNGNVNLVYSTNINVTTAVITPWPYIAKENVSLGKVRFSNSLNYSAAVFNSSNVVIYNQSIVVDSAANSELNVSADLWFYSGGFIDPVLLKDGSTCDICTEISSSTTMLHYNVTHFTNYSITENASINLTSPGDNAYANMGENNFTFIVYDSNGVDNCTVWGNFSGTYAQNNSNTTVVTISASNEIQVLGIGDGNYIWSVRCADSSVKAVFSAPLNYTVTVDTIYPSIDYAGGTEDTAVYLARDWIYVDVSIIEANFNNITFYLYNSTSLLNATDYTTADYDINFTGLNGNEYYYYNVTVGDKVGNENSTATRNITLDNTYPQIIYGAGTREDGAYARSVYINASVIETNFNNITFRLMDSSKAVINSTNYTTGIYNINFTDLTNEALYYYNVTVRDKANYENSTPTRNLTIDLTPPWNVTLYSPTPAYGIAGGEDVTFNWSVLDNLAVNLSCYPTVDDIEANITYSINGSYTDKTIRLTGGSHNISVTCYDYANNSNRSEIRTYIVGLINITAPLQNSIVRPGDIVSFNISVIYGQDYIDNITVQVNNLTGIEILQTTNVSTYYSTDYIVTGAPPRYFSATAYGFNNAYGDSINITSTILLRLGRIAGTTIAPSASYLCSNETYTMNNTNLTIITEFDLDSLVENANVTILHPNGNEVVAAQTANRTDDNGSNNYVQYFNFSYMPNVSGSYILMANIMDIDNQTIQRNTTLTVSNISKTVNLSSPSISAMSLMDRCTGSVLQSGAYIYMTMPAVSYYEMNATLIAEPKRMEFRNANFSADNITNLITHTTRTNESEPPTGERRVAMFDLEANFSFSNFTFAYNYSSIWYTLTTESALEFYRCGNISNCVFTKETVVLNTTTKMIMLTRDNMSRYLLTEPALSGAPALYDPPSIVNLNTTRTYVNANDSVNITLQFNVSLALDSVTLTVNSTALSAYSTINSGKQYWYYYDYFPATKGPYLIETVVYDENTFNDTSSLMFYADDNATIILSAAGSNNITVRDVNNNAELFSGQTITALTPAGKYNLFVETNNTDITINNASINTSVSSVMEFSDIEDTIAAPGNRTTIDEFEINSSIDFSSIDVAYDYTNLTSSITIENNLEVFKCEDASNCTWSEVSSTVDSAANTITFTVTNLSVFAVVEGSKTNVLTTTIIRGGGGGGTRIVETEKIANLEMIAPNLLTLYQKDMLTTPIILRNRGDIILNEIGLDVKSAEPGLKAELSNDYILMSDLGDENTVQLVLTSDADLGPGRHEITITANVKDPEFSDTINLYIDLTDKYYENNTFIMQKLLFVADLFDKNSECLELSELIQQANEAMEKGEYTKAKSLVDAAVNGCRTLIGAKEKEYPAPITLIRDNWNLALVIMVIALAVIISQYMWMRKRRKKKGYTKKK